jgi:hypothetical protein
MADPSYERLLANVVAITIRGTDDSGAAHDDAGDRR